MSRANFIEYYETWLRKPENQTLASEVDAITNEDEFAKVTLDHAVEQGFSFTEADVRSVMEESLACAQNDALRTVGSELSAEALETISGGLHRRLGLPSVQITSLQSIQNIGGNLADRLGGGAAYSTVMCCW